MWSKWIFAATGTGFWSVVGVTGFNMKIEWVVLSAMLLFAALLTLLDVLAPQTQQTQQTQRVSAPAHRP